MITIGVDAHKRVHVAYAIDEAGRETGQWRGANNASGWRELFAWAGAFGGERQWGIEGAWSYGRSLAQFLVGCGEMVFDVTRDGPPSDAGGVGIRRRMTRSMREQ